MDTADILLIPDMSGNAIWDEEYKYNLENRILIMNQEVNDRIIEDFVHYIIKWNREDKDIPVKKRKIITILISSIGGSNFDGQALIDVISMSKTRVRTIGIGFVASMAYMIFLSGDTRYSFANTTFLMHDGEITIQNSSKKASQTAEFFEKMDERTKQYILEKTSMDEEFYDQIYGEEYWMYPQEAKELGAVDKIIGEDCDMDEILE